MQENNIIIKESDLRGFVRNGIVEAMRHVQPLSEKLEVLGKNRKEANDVLRKIYVDYLAAYKPMLKRKQGVQPITLGDYLFKDCRLFIYVDDRDWPGATKPCFKGAFTNRGTFKSITITFNNIAMQTYYSFRAAILHELTHLLDDERTSTLPTERGWYRMSHRFANCNPITDIIYRLWTPTERNAYTTYGYNKDSSDMKEYISSLEGKIDQVERTGTNYTEKYWREIASYLFPKQVRPNTPVNSIVNFFVKKSRFLLKQFVKKSWQRHGQHYDDSDNTPDMKDLNYAADNKKVIDELDKFFLYDCIKLIKNDQTFDDWFSAKKAEHKGLTKKLAKYVWDRNIWYIVDMIKDDYPDDPQKQAWLKKNGFGN